eukprot:12300034-Alexandrium_andersonii.AAC.1
MQQREALVKQREALVKRDPLAQQCEAPSDGALVQHREALSERMTQIMLEIFNASAMNVGIQA